jgi:hypothetical protein
MFKMPINAEILFLVLCNSVDRDILTHNFFSGEELMKITRKMKAFQLGE